MNDEAAAIAAKLTPAQRRALLWLPGDGSSVLVAPGAPTIPTRRSLQPLGLSRFLPGRPVAYIATDLGLRVRAVLEADNAT